MIDPTSLRSYHRHLALHVLQGATQLTASELHEAMTTCSLAEGHPRECAAVSPAAVAGMLKGMQGENLVVQGPDKKNQRYGRDEPTWSAALGAAPVGCPAAPGTRAGGRGQDPAAAGAGELRNISVAQRLAFLQIESQELLKDLARDHAAFEERVRQQLAAFEARAMRLLGLTDGVGQ